jgi:hypothetical protein
VIIFVTYEHRAKKGKTKKNITKQKIKTMEIKIYLFFRITFGFLIFFFNMTLINKD